MNDFLKATTKGNTRTENGAISNSSTGSIFVDDFGKAGTYMGRDYLSVATTMSAMWATCPITTLRLAFYLRAITRKTSVKGEKTEKVQKGQGLKDEFLKRMLWVAYEHPEVFIKNLWLVPVAGSYRDIWQLLYLDSQIQNKLDRPAIYKEIIHDLADDDTKDLFLKYMPIPKAKSKLNTDRAKAINRFACEFRDFCDLDNKTMRKMKAGGTGHSWQQYISNNRYKEINWGHIPGKALFQLVKGKFLTNQGLQDSYLKWIQTQPVAKFTGYPFELFDAVSANITSYAGVNLSEVQKHTYDKQFEGLLQKGAEDEGGIKGNVWTALDTSGSMGSAVAGGKTSAYSVCASLGIYFSALNTGAFKDNVIMFDNHSSVMELKGTFTDRVAQIKKATTAWGGTNFQSVIDEIVRIRTMNPEIPVEDYPTTLLVVSDMQFNPAGNGNWRGSWGNNQRGATGYNSDTNYNVAMQKLNAVGLPNINIIWWQVTARTGDFPSRLEDEGTAVISGYDGAIISLILGGEDVVDEDTGKARPLTMQETFDLAVSQEIFNLIKI